MTDTRVLVVVALLAAGSESAAHPGPVASIELTTPADVEARKALAKPVATDLNQPRFRELMRTRVPDASPAAIEALGFGATTRTGVGGGWLVVAVVQPLRGIWMLEHGAEAWTEALISKRRLAIADEHPLVTPERRLRSNG